jgi:hypothetical protein
MTFIEFIITDGKVTSRDGEAGTFKPMGRVVEGSGRSSYVASITKGKGQIPLGMFVLFVMLMMFINILIYY